MKEKQLQKLPLSKPVQMKCLIFLLFGIRNISLLLLNSIHDQSGPYKGVK